MGLIYFIIFAVVIVVLIQNYYAFTQVISLAFFHIREIAFPLGLWFFIIFSIGFLVGYLRAVPAQVKSFTRSREISKLKKRVEELEKENQEKTERIRLMESQILNEKVEIERTEKPITIENVNPVKNLEQESSDK
jgi:TolA-binding protein